MRNQDSARRTFFTVLAVTVLFAAAAPFFI
jgi:hypothetical protein